MSIPPFKFLQACDFHLDRPPSGIGEVPEHLRGTLVEAPYRAAARVFDVALSERVDFVLLTGDLLHPPSSGPRGWFFLVEQFERLQHQGIKVYWTTGRDDAQFEWPALFPLPKNVWRFDCDGITRVVHERFGVPIAEICASGYTPRDKLRVDDFRPEHEGLFSLAVATGEIDAELAAKHDGVEYWALGGEHQRHSVFTSPVVAHYAGSPQGRSPAETGPHGCTLVNVDELGQVETTFLTTDVIRYQTERLTGIDTDSSEMLARVMSERATALAASGPDLLITWEIVGRGAAVRQLRRRAIEAELLAQLRAEWGRRQPAIYSLEVRAEPLGDIHESLFKEDSLRGEYLRLLKALDEATPDALDMREFLPDRFLVGPLAAVVAVDSLKLRERVLHDAALLGIDLLTGDAANVAPVLVPQHGRGEA